MIKVNNIEIFNLKGEGYRYNIDFIPINCYLNTIVKSNSK